MARRRKRGGAGEFPNYKANPVTAGGGKGGGGGFNPMDVLSEGTPSSSGGGINITNINQAIAQAINEQGPGNASGGITNWGGLGGGGRHHHQAQHHHHHH